MRTIVFAAHKGGCGKSTLATCLAVAAKESGESVVIFDLDPKGCAVRWGSKRMDRGLSVRPLSVARLASALEAAAQHGVTLAVIDAPVLESSAALGAVKAADLTIVPTLPGAFDIWAAEVTGRRIKLKKEKFVFLLNQCPPRRQSLRMRESIATLQSIGQLLEQQIGTRRAFLRAAATGKGVTEIEPRGSAAQEIRNLWLAIKNLPFRTPQLG